MEKFLKIYETRIRPYIADRSLLKSPAVAAIGGGIFRSTVVAKKSKAEKQQVNETNKLIKRQALEARYVEKARAAKEAVETANNKKNMMMMMMSKDGKICD